MRHCLKKNSDLSTRRSQILGAEFKTRAFQSTFVFSDASAFSAHSAVKLEDIVLSQTKEEAITRPSSSQNGT